VETVIPGMNAARVVKGFLRKTVRHGLLDLLAGGRRLRGRLHVSAETPLVQILLLHALRAGEEPHFRRLLGTLAERYTFLSYSEAVRRICSGEIDRPYLTLSFDDGRSSCLTAAEIMAEFGASACFFVCPTLLAETDPAKISDFCRDRLLIPPDRFLAWNDLESLVSGGHEIGSHALRHLVMKELSSAQLQEELGESRRALRSHLGQGRHFAWPYGRFHHFSPLAFREVFRVGYESCASAERGCHSAHDGNAGRAICLRRDNCEAGWPLSHTLYFLCRNADAPLAPDESWPAAHDSFMEGGTAGAHPCLSVSCPSGTASLGARRGGVAG